MRFKHACIESFGYVLPEQVVSSVELERRLAPVYKRFNLHEGRLELMSGIRERRFWEKGAPPSSGSTSAGRLALENSRVAPKDIDLLLHTSVSRDFLEPATASVVHHNLALSDHAGFYDISNACLGFLNGMITLAGMIDLGHVRRGLIVAGESSRQLVESTVEKLLAKDDLTRQEFKDAFASLTIGSGAAAVVMAHESVSRTGHRLLGGVVRAATRHNDLCRGSADTGFDRQASMLMNTDSETLLLHGCELAGQTWPLFKETLGWAGGDIGRFYTHQVGVAHREKLYEVLELNPARDFTTLEFLGNVGSASLPITLAMGVEKNPPRSCEQIAMLGIGSGLSCMMLGIKW